MLTSTIVAIALGVTPIAPDGTVQPIANDERVGRFTEELDRRGTSHIRGRDARGTEYDLTVDRHGYVEANVGDRLVTFRIRQAS